MDVIKDENKVIKVYLAGPDVFEPNAVELGKIYAEHARKRGLVGLFPLDNEVDFSVPKPDIQIYMLNREMLESADYIVANLNDFRGHEPDSGTVWEVAYGIGIGKKVIGYRSSDKTMVQSIGESQKVTQKGDLLVDQDGKTIENFGNPLNLMIQHSVDRLVFGTIEDALNAVVEMENAPKATAKKKF